MTAPSIPSDAGVEILFQDTSINESDPEISVTRSHLRYKVFDERGVQALQKIDVRYDPSEVRVTSIAARVVKPDGEVIDVDRKSFFTREVQRNRYYRYNAISFSPPGLEPGVIVEYKVSLQGEPNYAGFVPLQSEYPTKVVRFRVKPPTLDRLRLLTLFHRCPQLVPEPQQGFYVITVENLPGVKDEPFAPPDEQIRSWMIYYYTIAAKTVQEFWTDLGRTLFKENEKLLRLRPEIQRAADEMVAGAASELEKLERIDTFCRTRIRNIYGDTSGFTPDEIDKLKTNKGPADTLANGYGTAHDIRLLFVALARAAGFDARLARASDRNRMGFNPGMIVGMSLPDTIVAVKVAGKWWFAQPQEPYLAFGSLHWTNEGEVALVSDPKNPEFATTQISGGDKTLRKRTAHLRLNEEGTLEGDVTIELSGHLAASKKQEFDDATPGRREELVREEVADRLPAAKVTAISVENITAPSGPAIIRYHLELPGYAQITGQRLFIQPAVFEVGTVPVFGDEKREHLVFFPFQSTEIDHVEIELPEGFELENAHSPESLDPSPALRYEARMAFRKKDRLLLYDRTFQLNLRAVSTEQYGMLKRVFDHVHQQDAHSVGVGRVAEVTVRTDGDTAATGN